MWEGSYLSRTAESVFSWGVITELTESLMERGEYKIKLGLQNAPVMAEQLALFDMGSGAAVYEMDESQNVAPLFPARELPQAVIDQTLYTAGNESGSEQHSICGNVTKKKTWRSCAGSLVRKTDAVSSTKAVNMPSGS